MYAYYWSSPELWPLTSQSNLCISQGDLLGWSCHRLRWKAIYRSHGTCVSPHIPIWLLFVNKRNFLLRQPPDPFEWNEQGKPLASQTRLTQGTVLIGFSPAQKFLSSLEITFRRDPSNFRPRINKADSLKDKEQKGTFHYRSLCVAVECDWLTRILMGSCSFWFLLFPVGYISNSDRIW